MSKGEIEYLDETLYSAENSGEKTLHHNYERIAMQGMTGANDKIRIIMSIVPAGYYLANSCNYLLPNEEFPAKYLLGLLNSKLINWFFRKFSTNSNVNGYEVEQFPIPSCTNDSKQRITDLVDVILNKKKQRTQADTSAEEQQIDHLVYHLYGLSYDEVLIIDPSISISREDY